MRKLRADTVYLILSCGSGFFNALMFTVLTVYYVNDVRLNPLQLVLVGTVLEITEFICEVPTGIVADLHSRRLSVIIGTLVMGASFALVGSVPIYGVVLLGNIIWGIGWTFVSGAREAWLVDEVGEEHAGPIFLRATQLRQLSILVGTFVSVGLASIYLGLPLIVGGLMTVVLGLVLIITMPETAFHPVTRSNHSLWQAMNGIVRDGTQAMRGNGVLRTLLLVAIFGGAAAEALDRLGDAHFLTNFTFPQIGQLAPVVWFGIINAGAQLLSIAATSCVRWRIDTTNSRAVACTLLLSEVLSVAGIIVFGLAGNFPLALAAFWIRSVAATVAGPLYTTWANQHIAPQVRATVLSMLSQGDALGQFTGGPLIGAVGTVFSLRAAIVTAGIALIPALPLYALALRHAGATPFVSVSDEGII